MNHMHIVALVLYAEALLMTITGKKVIALNYYTCMTRVSSTPEPLDLTSSPTKLATI